MKVIHEFEKEIEESCDLKIKEIISKTEKVITCRAINEMNDYKTIKVIFNKSFFKSENSKSQILHELKISKLLQFSNNFIKLENHVYTQNYLILIYEDYINCCIENMQKEIDIGQYIPIVFKDLVDAIVVLRENKLIHHQVTLKNIYIINGYVKLGGLEHVHAIATPLPPFYANCEKSLEYLSPEFYTKKHLIYPSQVFSLGVSIYKLLFNKYPFDQNLKSENHFSEFYLKTKTIVLKPAESCVEANIYLVMKECLQVDYSERITIRYLKNTLDNYCKSRGSILTMRKNALVKTKEGGKKNGEFGKLAKESSFNSYHKC